MMNKGMMGNLMQQAQKMQENLKKAQEELARMETEGSAGAGMVKVLMTGKHDLKRVTIDQSVMDDKEMLEDLIAAAVNDAVRKIEATSAEKMGSMTQGMGLPLGMKLPF